MQTADFANITIAFLPEGEANESEDFSEQAQPILLSLVENA